MEEVPPGHNLFTGTTCCLGIFHISCEMYLRSRKKQCSEQELKYLTAVLSLY